MQLLSVEVLREGKAKVSPRIDQSASMKRRKSNMCRKLTISESVKVALPFGNMKHCPPQQPQKPTILSLIPSVDHHKLKSQMSTKFF